MKVLILARTYLGNKGLTINYDSLAKVGIKTSILTTYDAKGQISLPGHKVATNPPLRHFTNIINKSWGEGIMLACKAADYYHEERFEVVQVNDLAALIAGVHLKWSFGVSIVFVTDGNELTAVESKDDDIHKGMEEVMQFCLQYVDHVVLINTELSRMFQSRFQVPKEKIEVSPTGDNKIPAIYGNMVTKK